MKTDAVLAGSLEQCPIMKISEKDTNKFVLLCDGTQFPFVSVVEIFDEGGKTPPNIHMEAHEYFYVILGEGEAVIAGETVPLAPGCFLIVSPGHTHEVRNTGKGKLYCLTTMIPDEKFSDLIKSGVKAELDEEDRKVLAGLAMRV